MPTPLRPMSTLEVLDAAWLAVRRNWMELYACSFAGTAPLALATIGYFLWLGRLVKGTEPQVFYNGTLTWAVIMAVAWGINGIARAAGTEIVLADARSETLTLSSAWKNALRAGPSAAFVALFCFCLALIGTLALVPGVGMICAWWVARPALLTEKRPFMAALRRSGRLTQGYRGKAFGLWLLLLLIWLMGFFNLHLLALTLLGWVASLLGIDTTGLLPYVKLNNQAYTMFLLALGFVLLDPLKTAADTLLYLDLRVRREGADLQERFRSLRAGAGIAVAALALLMASPARAVTLDEYRSHIRALRQEISEASGPDKVPNADVGQVRDQLVKLPGGQQLTVGNDWLRDGMEGWQKPADKQQLLDRLDALDRSLGSGPAAASPSSSPSSTGIDAKQSLREVLADPEFQPLAERTELRDFTKSISLKNTKSWWDSFWDYLRKTFFKPPPAPKLPRPNLPKVKAPELGWMGHMFDVLKWVAIGLAVILVLVLLAQLVRFFLERGQNSSARAASGPTEAPPLEASATENALDHTVDEWELFAREWLGRGDVRQAVRALYLATLVHLHRERQIEYDRAFTNWTYVRQFRGEADRKSILQRLTQVFDEIWYGERPCEEPQYRDFEQGARALGTPAPVIGPARG